MPRTIYFLNDALMLPVSSQILTASYQIFSHKWMSL